MEKREPPDPAAMGQRLQFRDGQMWERQKIIEWLKSREMRDLVMTARELAARLETLWYQAPP